MCTRSGHGETRLNVTKYMIQPIGDLSEGSSDSSESDDHPKSTVVKPSVNKCHPTAHKDRCPRSELSRVGSNSGVVIELMDDNKVPSELFYSGNL